MHGILFLRCHARLKSRPRASVMWQMHVINKPSFVFCSFQIIEPAVAVLLFVTILQKYAWTLRIVWTRRCCFYHESKMSMTPQWLLCLWVLYTTFPLKSTPYEKQMKGSKNLYTPACTAILVFTELLAQPRCFVCDLTSPASFFSFTRKFDGVILMLFFISQ